MSKFKEYSNAIYDAFSLHHRQKEVIDRKYDIVNKISEYYNEAPSSILFVGFNPAILNFAQREVYITEISEELLLTLQEHNPDIKYLSEPKKFDLIVATDEYLTFADSDEAQKATIDNLCRMCQGIILTTVKDYKNQEFREREYSQPAIIKHGDKLTAFSEIHNWDQKDKNAWTTCLYQLDEDQPINKGTYKRRALYFKQLAKFTSDMGASNFLVHKNLMFKSLIKKNYEHVISIHFEN